MKTKEIKFYIEYDKLYSQSYASGLEISSVNQDRLDLSFHYEKMHSRKEINATLTEEGKVEPKASDNNILEIDRIIKTSVSLDRETAENLLALLKEQLEQ